MQGNDISTQILGWTNHQGLNYRKKVQNCTLGCSVQCRGMFCCVSLLLGGSQSPGALFTKWQDCLEWEQLLPYAGGRAVLLQPGWGRWFFFFLYFCIFKMGWKDLKRSTDCHRAWATTSRVTWAPWSPENGTSLPSKFSCQFKSSSVKPTHIVPLVEGSTFSGGNYEQSCSSKMPFGGASPLSRGDGGSTRIIALAQERSILPQSSLCFITFPPALMGTTK